MAQWGRWRFMMNPHSPYQKMTKKWRFIMVHPNFLRDSHLPSSSQFFPSSRHRALSGRNPLSQHIPWCVSRAMHPPSARWHHEGHDWPCAKSEEELDITIAGAVCHVMTLKDNRYSMLFLLWIITIPKIPIHIYPISPLSTKPVGTNMYKLTLNFITGTNKQGYFFAAQLVSGKPSSSAFDLGPGYPRFPWWVYIWVYNGYIWVYIYMILYNGNIMGL